MKSPTNTNDFIVIETLTQTNLKDMVYVPITYISEGYMVHWCTSL